MFNNILIQTDEYKLKLISSAWSDSIIIYISNEEFGEDIKKINENIESDTNLNFTICELDVNDWDRYLTPWETNAKMKGRIFSGKASELIQKIGKDIVPVIKQQAPEAEIYIAGYSLAGLFSLWSIYECEFFKGCACCSGSVWYPGWIEYAQTHKIKKGSYIYLSLGDREKNSKHSLMKNVEDNMMKQYDILKKDSMVRDIQFELNEGGHFNNTEQRVEKGIKWLIETNNKRQGDNI